MIVCRKSSVEMLLARMKHDADFVMCFDAIDRFLSVNSDYDRFTEVYDRNEQQFRLYDLTADIHIARRHHGGMLDSCVNGNTKILEFLLAKGYRPPSHKIIVQYIQRICTDGSIDTTRTLCYDHLDYLFTVVTVYPLRADILETIAIYNDADLFAHVFPNLEVLADKSLYHVVAEAACKHANYEILGVLESNGVAVKPWVKLISTDLDFLRHVWAKYAPQVDNRDYMGIRSAIGHGCLDLVLFHMNNPIKYYSDKDMRTFIDQAAGVGAMDILLHFLQNRSPTAWDGRALVNAAMGGHMDIVRMLASGTPDTWTLPATSAIDAAASAGHEEIVRYLDQLGIYGCTVSAMDNAAKNGHYSIVKYLDEHRSEGCSSSALAMAVKAGNYKIVEYLLDNRTEGDVSHVLGTSFANIDVVRLLLARGASVSQVAIDQAALTCQIEALPLLGWPRRPVSSRIIYDLHINELPLIANYIIQRQPDGMKQLQHEYLLKTSGQIDLAGKDGPLSRIYGILFHDATTTEIIVEMLMCGYIHAYRLALTTRPFPMDMLQVSSRISNIFGRYTLDYIFQPLAVSLVNVSDEKVTRMVARQSAANGSIQLFRHLLLAGIRLTNKDIGFILCRAQLDIIKLLVASAYYIPKQAIFEVTIQGRTDVIEYLYPHQSQSTQRSITSLATFHNVQFTPL
eukprot:gene19725-23630_t